MSAFVQRLRRCTKLTDEDLHVVGAVPIKTVQYEPREDIVREGDYSGHCFIILNGVSCSYKSTGKGERQITAFHIAGDVPDLNSLHLDTRDTSYRAVSACTVGFVRHGAMHTICAGSYDIAGALWRMTLIDGAVFREWEVNLGRREAKAAMAHLLCEQYYRFMAVGLVDGTSFKFPVTQQEMGEALGLSAVHVNRTVQYLRAKRLVEFENGRVAIPDISALAAEGDFQPDYLHLGQA